jgi:hypothetical protein
MKMTDETWLVVTSSNSWGKGDNFREAMANALKEAGRYKPTQAHVYRFTGEHERQEVYCDDMGTVHYPIACKLTKLARWDIPAVLVKAFSAFDEECEEVRYGRSFSIFDEDDEMESNQSAVSYNI